MGSIPNGSAPLQACARQIFNSMLPGRTGKAQVRLAAAGRLRSAVALELAAGKVWALPKPSKFSSWDPPAQRHGPP
jgi:hypothetical protein